MGDLAQLVFSVPNEVAEAVGNLLTEVTGSGFEQRDADTLDTPEQEGNTELLVCLSASSVDGTAKSVEKLLASLAEMGKRIDPWSWRSEEIAPEAWVDVYKQYFKVNRLAKHTIVKPSWESYDPQPGDLLIDLDPGQAFGTGLHASTKLCISALERSARLGPTPAEALDVGCGTGILAIVMAKLWPGCRVLAVDNDPTAVQVAKENVERNGVADRVAVEHRSGTDLDGAYGIITANLQLETLREMAPILRQRVGELGRLIMSGLLADQAAEIQRIYTHDLLLESEYTEQLEGWRSVIVRQRG